MGEAREEELYWWDTHLNAETLGSLTNVNQKEKKMAVIWEIPSQKMKTENPASKARTWFARPIFQCGKLLWRFRFVQRPQRTHHESHMVELLSGSFGTSPIFHNNQCQHQDALAWSSSIQHCREISPCVEVSIHAFSFRQHLGARESHGDHFIGYLASWSSHESYRVSFF